MEYLPIALAVRDQPCLVIGGGEVALRKIDLLRSAGARVRVVALEAKHGVRELARRGDVELSLRAYATGDLDGVRVVIAATNDREVNARAAHEAQQRGVPVNVVDDPELCSFIVPAIVDRAPITIAISTAGASPVLARLVRARLSSLLHPRLGELASFAARHRARVRELVQDATSRRELWERVLDGEAADHLLAGDELAADAALLHAIESAARGTSAAHAVHPVQLVPLPPAGTDALTLRALRVVGRVDVVAFTAAGAQAVRLFARRDATQLELTPEASASRLRELTAAAREGARTCVLCDPERATELAVHLGQAGFAHVVVQ